MQTEKFPLDVYEARYGAFPSWFKLLGCAVVRAADHITNKADLSIELPGELPLSAKQCRGGISRP